MTTAASSLRNPLLNEVRSGEMPLHVAVTFLTGTYAEDFWTHAGPEHIDQMRVVVRRLARLDPKPWLMRHHDRGVGQSPRAAHPDFDEPEWYDRENTADYVPRLPRDIH